MKILNKILVFLVILAMTLSISTIVNQSMAVSKQTTSAKEERTKAINTSKQKYPELTAGYGMKTLNRSPIPSFQEGSNGKINVNIEDGVGIDYIKVKNANTKKETTKTIPNKTTKQYTTTFTAPKTNKTKTMVYTVKDVSGLTSKVTCVTKNKEDKYSFDVSMRVTFSYSDGKLNLILKDDGGINKDEASVEVIDKNANNKSIAKVSAKGMKLKDTTEYNKKIIQGIYSIDIKKLTKDKDGKYKVQVKTTDCNGNPGSRMAKFTVDNTSKNTPTIKSSTAKNTSTTKKSNNSNSSKIKNNKNSGTKTNSKNKSTKKTSNSSGNSKKATTFTVKTANAKEVSYPLNIAHRGIHENKNIAGNTAEAFKAAIKNKNTFGIETDIRMTKNGVLICSHNEKLKTINNKTIKVSKHDWNDISNLEFLEKKTNKKYKLATFEEYLNIVKKSDCYAIVELKTSNEKAIKKVLDTINKNNMQYKTIIISFKYNSLKYIRNTIKSDIQLGYLVNYSDTKYIDKATKIGAIICPSYRDKISNKKIATEKYINYAHQKGIKVNVWTINSDTIKKELKGNGVDFITTDKI